MSGNPEIENPTARLGIERLTDGSETEEPSNDIDRLLYSILAHERKRPKEVAALTTDSRFNQQVVKRRLRELPDKYSWAGCEESGNRTYYFRTDLDESHRELFHSADSTEVDKLFQEIEIQLGLTSRDLAPTPTKTTESLSCLFNRLLEMSQNYALVFSNRLLLSRFENIFDRVIWYAETAYGDEQMGEPTMAYEAYNLFFLTVVDRHEHWQVGVADDSFDNVVQCRRSDLVDLVGIAPPAIGVVVQPLLSLADTKSGRDGFKQMLLTGQYEVDDLMYHAYHPYIVQNEIDQLIDDLQMVRQESEDKGVRQQVETLCDKVRYRHRS